MKIAPVAEDDDILASKSEIAYLRVKQDIVTGRLVEDTPLRIEALKASYDLGVTPIREALARLEVEGFVQLRPNRGYFTTRLSPEDFDDLLFSRFTLERELLRRSIQRGDEAWEVAVVSAHHLLGNCRLDLRNLDLAELERWEDRHIAFHLALLGASGSRRLLAFLGGLHDHFRRHQKALILLPIANRAVQGDADAELAIRKLESNMALDKHTRLMEAALARDSDLAMRLMDDHAVLTPFQIQALHVVTTE